MSKALRYYQLEAAQSVESALSKGVVKQLVCMATGTGKSRTATEIIKGKGRVLWGTHTEELISQSGTVLLAELNLMPYDELIHTIDSHGDLIELVRNYNRGGIFLDPKTKLIGENIGIVKADVFSIDKPFVVASMQTLWQRLDRFDPHHFGVVVCDECHYFMAKTYKQSVDFFKPKLRLGLSATPFRSDDMLLSDLFDEIVYNYPIEKAMADGYLCKIDAIQLKTSADLDDVHSLGGEFKQNELTVKINTLARNNQIVNGYLEHAPGRKFIAFCVDVQHAIDLCEAFNEKGIRCKVVVGDKEITPERKKTIAEFEDGDSDLMGLITVNVLVAGYDYPNLGCTISACPTKSKVKFLQGPVGRLTRLKDAKYVAKYGQAGILIDVVDNTTKHKLVNTYTLDKDLPVEKKIFISEKNRQLLLDVKAERERTMSVAVKLQDIKVDLFQLPKVTISESFRMQEPATEKQLAWIAKLGYDVVNVHYTKLMCSEIVSMQSATDKQIGFLKFKGYDVSNGVTVSEAAAAFAEIKAREERQRIDEQTKGFKLPFNL